MKRLDYIIQNWRFREASAFIKYGSKLLDIGCHQGELFSFLGNKIDYGEGFDPLLKKEIRSAKLILRAVTFSNELTHEKEFDCITILAVIEHIPKESLHVIPVMIFDLLKQGGRVIVTVPAKPVDIILKFLCFFRLIDGMSIQDHHGFNPSDLLDIFQQNSFTLVARKRFQFFLNNLFVFEKTG
jgi:2-polyprenyl-3-methyl-5-hydroxy-6-metoxy-1,4-benzoquinol methylase